MSKPFQRPPVPLTDKEKERYAENFMDGAPRTTPRKKGEKAQKEVLFLRIPRSLHDDLMRLEELTGYKKTMFCLQAIIEAAKEKLKEIEREKS